MPRLPETAGETLMTGKRPILRLLVPFWPLLLFSAVSGVIAGWATVALLAAMNDALAQGRLDQTAVLNLVGLCVLSFAGSVAADISTNICGQGMVAKVRRFLAEKILTAPLDALEGYRTHRLMPVLTGDVDMISDIAFVLAPLAIATSIVLGCIIYLAGLSPALCFVVVLVLGVGSVLTHMARAKGIAGFVAARDGEDALHKAYRTMSEGAKELRLSRPRRVRLFNDEILATIRRIRLVNTRAINVFVVANALGAMLFLLIIVALLASAGWADIEQKALTGFVLVLLYMKGPIEQIMMALPPLARAQVAIRRIQELSGHFQQTGAGPAEDPPLVAGARDACSLHSSIDLENVTYGFLGEEGAKPFTLGPLTLTVRPDEVLFIVGDNGSGKTTLIKLLLGLYAPHSGAIRKDGVEVTNETRDAYRQCFSAVMSDFFLFADLQAVDDAETAASYLQRLKLDHKVGVADGRLTTTDLSTGQRKRLALVNAYLERRPVIVFDEWAADQDPHFRHVFYEELLPEMKAQGRTLIVISHDDRYFHVADRIVRLTEGRIAEDQPAPRKDERSDDDGVDTMVSAGP